MSYPFQVYKFFTKKCLIPLGPGVKPLRMSSAQKPPSPMVSIDFRWSHNLFIKKCPD